MAEKTRQTSFACAKKPEIGRLEEILNIKNKETLNYINLVLCFNFYLLLQLSASQQFLSIAIYTNICCFPNSSSEDFDLHSWWAKQKQNKKRKRKGKEKVKKCHLSSEFGCVLASRTTVALTSSDERCGLYLYWKNMILTVEHV